MQYPTELSKENESFPVIRKDEQKPLKRHQKEKKGKQPGHNQVSEKSPKLPTGQNNNENSDDGRVQGTYIIGGSNFGWNFITYRSSNAVYYGVTKESFRSKK